jgi:hypothetical protein
MKNLIFNDEKFILMWLVRSGCAGIILKTSIDPMRFGLNILQNY